MKESIQQNQGLTSDFGNLIRSLTNQIDALSEQVASLQRAIANTHEPLVGPQAACQILRIGRDKLESLCLSGVLREGQHWYYKNPGSQLKRRVFYRDVILDFAIRGESDPVGHTKFCINFHKRKDVMQ